MGQKKTPLCRLARRALRMRRTKLRSRTRAIMAAPNIAPPAAQAAGAPAFRQLMVSCERADLRPLPERRHDLSDGAARGSMRCRRSDVPRAEVIDELYARDRSRRRAAARRRLGDGNAGSVLAICGPRAKAATMRAQHQVATCR